MVATPGDPPRAEIPSDPTNGAYISEIWGEVPITIAYGGSCTAGKEDDIDMYARVMDDACARPEAPSYQTGSTSTFGFGSIAVEEYARKKGYLRVFEETGVKMISAGLRRRHRLRAGRLVGAGSSLGVGDQPQLSEPVGARTAVPGLAADVAASAVAGKIVATRGHVRQAR